MAGTATVDQIARRMAVHPSTVGEWREKALEAIDAATLARSQIRNIAVQKLV